LKLYCGFEFTSLIDFLCFFPSTEISLPKMDSQSARPRTIAKERYIFRCIEQVPNQPIEVFVNRLKNQIAKCGFTADETEDRLKEQIIEKCLNPNLRKIAFKMEMSVENLLVAGTILENESNGKHCCTRCGYNDHSEIDSNCPARRSNVMCSNCGRFGHFARMCKLISKKVSFADVRAARDAVGKTHGNLRSCLKRKQSEVVKIPAGNVVNRNQFFEFMMRQAEEAPKKIIKPCGEQR
jgi:hypothetical protein